ncbi:MAG TPA: acylneuraminate cytidylyltransferase family protein [Nitrospirales bacterium]|nr:acylneuraminate cytidylyltransferase family protein [Nitrospirales bacterium]
MKFRSLANQGIVGVIHARGGSKRIPLKNIKPLAGRPLVTYIIEAALESQLLDRVIVSTDHQEIARIARDAGAEVPFMRPADIAEDVPSELVTQHAVQFLEAEGYPVSVVLTMQPTTPFCTGEDIDACIAKLIEHDLDTVFTACEVHERPEWMYRPDGEQVLPYTGRLVQGEAGVSQKLPKLYIPNGAVWATRRSVLMDDNLITGPKAGVVVMSRERSVDIDEPVDFITAEAMANEIVKVRA